MTVLVTAIALPVLAWFVAGTIWNVRRGRKLMTWMQGGLPLLGERTTVRWLGSTAVEMLIRQAKAPFEQVTLIVFLEPRDVPWMWALAHASGRRDTLIVRGHLRRAPRADLEALDGASWSARDARHGLAREEWSVRPPSRPGALETWTKTPSALTRADELVALAAGARLTLRRLSARRSEPHFTLHLAPPGAGTPASAFFEAVRALAERAGG
jgi:hypothetical protein